MPPAAEPTPLISMLPLDDPELRDIVVTWSQSLSDNLAKMHAATRASQVGALAELAHWLKGSGGTAGYPAFTEVAARIERHAREGELSEVEALLAEVDRLAEAVHAGLSAA
jgi:HPt (histidine-containing phosphotransfer) domain-containing protein